MHFLFLSTLFLFPVFLPPLQLPQEEFKSYFSPLGSHSRRQVGWWEVDSCQSPSDGPSLLLGIMLFSPSTPEAGWSRVSSADAESARMNQCIECNYEAGTRSRLEHRNMYIWKTYPSLLDTSLAPGTVICGTLESTLYACCDLTPLPSMPSSSHPGG